MAEWQMSKKEAYALKRRRAAVNKRIDKMDASGKYDYTPNKRSFEEESELIHSKKEYTRRMRELGTFLEKGAEKVVTHFGFKVPYAMRRQIRNLLKTKNSRIREERSADYLNLDMLSKQQQLAASANKDLDYYYEEDYITGDDMEELEEIVYQDMGKVAEIYITVWEDNGGDEDIPEIMRYLAANDPSGFHDLMNDPFNEETEIDYIYPEVMNAHTAKSGFTYKRSSANKTAYHTRMERAADFWREQYWDYQNREGYFR